MVTSPKAPETRQFVSVREAGQCEASGSVRDYGKLESTKAAVKETGSA